MKGDTWSLNFGSHNGSSREILSARVLEVMMTVVRMFKGLGFRGLRFRV